MDESNVLLDAFIAEAQSAAASFDEPADCVQALAPAMQKLVLQADTFLTPAHLQSDPGHYSRNAILMSSDQSLSLYALIWLPGQWTPIHDHGSWGVVGIVRGLLEERSYIRIDANRHSDDNIDLVRGGVFLMGAGSVSTFVPNPDHIHVTGVAEGSEMTVSLHLYGRNMNDFCMYDLATRSRKRVALVHNES